MSGLMPTIRRPRAFIVPFTLAVDADVAVALDLTLDGGALHDAVDLSGADGSDGLLMGSGALSLRNM
jgi:hypothetical protein